MDAEIQFFMLEKDELEFLSYANQYIDSVEKNDTVFELLIDDCKLIFTPSVLQGNTLYKGVLEIRLGVVEAKVKGTERSKSVFRKLRNWIKKNYFSRLAYLNENKKSKLTPSRVHWLAPNAKKWKEQDQELHKLKLSTTSWMVFEIGF